MLSKATRPHRACAPWAAIHFSHTFSPIHKVEPNPEARYLGINFQGVNDMEPSQREFSKTKMETEALTANCPSRRSPSFRECSRLDRCPVHSTNKPFLFVLVAFVLVFIALAGQTATGQTFQHPGVLVSKAQLDFMKAQVNAHVEPFYSAYQNAIANPYGSLTPSDNASGTFAGGPAPQGPPSTGTIDCGSSSNPDTGCTADDEDGAVAYVQALLWYITGNQTYANNAIKILNAYGHGLNNFTNSNGPLQAAWSGSKWPRAAEIIRYSNAGWAPADATAFGNMLNSAMVPLIQNGSTNNANWELSMIEAMIGIAVYNNDATLYNHALGMLNNDIPNDFMTTGQDAETCRDMGHALFELAATINAAETVHIQGGNVYESGQQRLAASLEFHTGLLEGKSEPLSGCSSVTLTPDRPTFVIGYNEFHNRLGMSLPNTQQWLPTVFGNQVTSPGAWPGTPVDHHMVVYETLTHAADAGATPQPDFTFSASPGSQTITAGAGTSYTVSVSPVNSFTGNVSLTVSGLPSGATGSFSSSTISGGSGSSTLNISTSASTAPGNYTLTITGLSGSTSHTATLTLSINAQPDFTISASPASLTLTAGASGSSTVSVGVINGFSGVVALSVSGVPSGVTATLSSSSVNAPGSATLTVNASSSAAAGTSTLTITGTNGTATHTATVSLTINVVTPSCVTTTTNGPWQNAAFANQTGTFTAVYDVTPSATKINAVVGLSNGVQTAYTGFAVITRFNPSGNIDARSGGSYTAMNTIPYSGGVSYHFRVVVNIAAHTYSAFVTPAGGTEQTIGTNLNFRTEQNTVSQLNWVGAFSEVGTETLCSFTLNPSSGDFSLSASPASQTVTAGNSTSYTVTVTANNGFTSTVTPSVSGLPTGATASFNPATVAGSGTTTMTINTASSMGQSTSSLTITGTSGSLSHTATVSLTVNPVTPPPDFSLSASPTSQTVTAGNSTSYTMTVTANNGFTGTVTPSINGLPAGATASFNPATVAGSGTSTMTINTASSMGQSTSSLTITGTSGTLSHTAAVSLTVNAAPQPDFTVSASPALLTVTAGNSASSTVNVGVVNGFSGAVALSVSGAPLGATATLSSNSVNAPGTVTLTISTASSMGQSTSTLTISGTSGGVTHAATVSLTVNPVTQTCVTTTTNGPWQNTAFANQTGTLTVAYDVTPSAAKINAVVGLSNGVQTAYTGFAAITRFNPSGNIDARSGGSYTAINTIPYSGGVTYHFRLVVNIPAHTYSAFVTAPGQAEQTIGTNLNFRTEQATVSQLNWVGAFSEVGTETLCNFTLNPGSGGSADFTLSASPNTVTISAGNSASYTATVSPSNGYTGSVALAASGLPSGATATFSPASIGGGSGSSTMSITTASSTPAGSYTVTITGTDSGAGLSHATSVTLTINAQSFTLGASPASETVTAGSSTTFTATVSPVNGFTGTVTLSANGLPSGATASFSPASITGGSGSSTLTINTTSATTTGTATITISGTDGTRTNSATVSLTVNPAGGSCAHGNGPLDPSATPGCNFDLTNWSLQLPIGSPGNPTTISNTQLENGFTDPYFFTASDGAMAFFDPGVNCVTTANSSHCRSELREENADGTDAVWTPSGTNTMSATLAVTQDAGAPVIGQIHLPPSFSVKPLIELYYNYHGTGNIVAGVEIDPVNGGQNTFTLAPDFPLGTKFSYEISYTHNVLTVTLNGTPHQLAIPSGVAGQGGYFKAGDYGQIATGAAVQFYSLKVTHGP
jgi:hypothetical protein